uniref:Uncharacterized protein n=1 Tax=Coccidioides posadasii RMSCC 3488 TaxID=454284 RepID=A0A0J6FIK7_COCPO|nr:hypothetical protein CPAG_09320 [Coccidioides posadasii RMSCC 3488]
MHDDHTSSLTISSTLAPHLKPMLISQVDSPTGNKQMNTVLMPSHAAVHVYHLLPKVEQSQEAQQLAVLHREIEGDGHNVNHQWTKAGKEQQGTTWKAAREQRVEEDGHAFIVTARQGNFSWLDVRAARATRPYLKQQQQTQSGHARPDTGPGCGRGGEPEAALAR